MSTRLLLLVALALLSAMTSFGQNDTRSVSDMGEAKEWCDAAMLHRIEGIWEFPADETKVLMRRIPGRTAEYEIIVLESPDVRMRPGDRIGTMKGSVSPVKFDMYLCTGRRNDLPVDPRHCLATLDDKNGVIITEGPKFKLSLASRWFLPSFWRALRVSVKNPADDLPHGLVRIYPSENRREPDYL